MIPYYEGGFVTLYHGDCADVLPDLKRHDLLLTDPPYGIKEDHRSNLDRIRSTKTWKNACAKDYGEYAWDSTPAPVELVQRCISMADKAIIFGGNYYPLPPARCWLIWDKENSGNFSDAELAWTNMDQAVRLKRHLWNGFQKKHPEQRFHPTQKPLDVMSWCLEQAGTDVRTVLDPFAGSGTTLLAAKLRNQFATGVEREERYCEIIANRLSQDVFDFSGNMAQTVA